MACIGCMVGAVGFSALWGGGKVLELLYERRRGVAMRRVLEEDRPGSGAAETQNPSASEGAGSQLEPEPATSR